MSGWAGLALASLLSVATAARVGPDAVVLGTQQQLVEPMELADDTLTEILDEPGSHNASLSPPGNSALPTADGQTDARAGVATTYDTSFCWTSKCTFTSFSSCEAGPDVDRNLHYIHHSSVPCLWGLQHQCCAQTCKADVECPSQSFCQGFNSGQKYCYHCQDCPS